ncbi:MAG: hypothetical protein NC177_18145, partial [Ruminococcus flavefaciens]|nr:hypothetical protein [Ruminococcus flavefaciens]
MATPLRRAIAVDFDGCICTNEYPKIGIPYQKVIDAIKDEQERGSGIILWTCREGRLLEEALNACKEWGLKFDAVNDSLSDWKKAFGTDPRKVGASEYWDDKAKCIPKDVDILGCPDLVPLPYSGLMSTLNEFQCAKDKFIFDAFAKHGYSKDQVLELCHRGRITCDSMQHGNLVVYYVDGEEKFGIES